MFSYIPRLLSSMLFLATCICIMAIIYSSFLKDNVPASQMMENIAFGCNSSLFSSASIACIIVLMAFVQGGHYDELKSDIKSKISSRSDDDED